jgi:hypothetical protein
VFSVGIVAATTVALASAARGFSRERAFGLDAENSASLFVQEIKVINPAQIIPDFLKIVLILPLGFHRHVSDKHSGKSRKKCKLMKLSVYFDDFTKCLLTGLVWQGVHSGKSRIFRI